MPREPKPAATPEEAPPPEVAWLRWFLVACYLVTIFYTAKVWQIRGDGAEIPNLPLGDAAWLDAVQLPMGELMIVSLVLVLAYPLQGLITHTTLLAVAVILDQARLQPEFVSLTILLWATLPWQGARMIGRAHLIALWFFAGLHKLLSAEYMAGMGARFMEGSFPHLSHEMLQTLAVLTAIYEMSLGILAVFPYARRAVPSMAAALHLGAVVSLVGQNWNSAVWPWNVALAGVGFGLLWDDDPPWAACRRCAWGWSVAAACVLVSPLLFYCSSFDAYLCHCLYSSNVPTANVSFSSESVTMLSFRTLNVPLPPEHRLYEQLFRRRAHAGDEMEIRDCRWWMTSDAEAATKRCAVRHFRCESDGTIVEVP